MFRLTKHVEDLAARAAAQRLLDTQGGEQVGGGSRGRIPRQGSSFETRIAGGVRTRIAGGVRTLVNAPASLVRGARALPLLQLYRQSQYVRSAN